MPLLRPRPVARTVARTAVVAGTASAVSGRVHRRQQQRWADQDQAAYDQQMAAQPAPAAAPVQSEGDADVAEIQKLADLHAQGILTDEEFAAKKAQILGI
jgi:hypothetical protein